MASQRVLEQAQKRLSIISGPRSPALLSWTFNDLLNERFKHSPQDIAVISQHQNDSITYSDLKWRSEQLAAGLFSIGVRQGDRVAILLGNRAEYVDVSLHLGLTVEQTDRFESQIFFACSKLGAYVTLLNYAYSPSELHNALLVTTAKVLLTTLGTSRFEYGPTLDSLSTSLQALKHVIVLEDISGQITTFRSSEMFLTYQDLLSFGAKSEIDLKAYSNNVKCSDILNLQFTSGSTGLPKAAALTHHGMINSARYIALQMKITPSERINIPVPLFHAFGLIIGQFGESLRTFS